MLVSHQVRRTTETRDAPDFIDITDELQDALDSSGVTTGQVTVFAPDDGCAILVNEFETGLLKDLRRTVTTLTGVWPRAVIGSRSVVLPALDGRLRLGTWQRVLLVELDRPGSRSIVIQILGERERSQLRVGTS